MSSLLASRLAALYNQAPTNPEPWEINDLQSWIVSQYEMLPMPVAFVDHDIDLPDTVAHYEQYGTLLISTANNNHPFLNRTVNAYFRAIHDAHHIAIGADSTLSGEIAAFRYARDLAPKSLHWLLFSEIVLQAAACIANNGEFQPQQTVKVGGF